MQTLLHLVVPAIVIAVILLTLPKRLLDVEPGYTGPASLLSALRDLVRYSFVHSATGVRGLGALLPIDSVISGVTNFVIPFALVIFVPIGARIAVSRNIVSVPPNDKFLLLLAVALPLNALLIFLSRPLFGMPYPELRTAMYWLPMLSLAALVTLQKLRSGDQAERFVAAPLAALLVLCVVQFATQFNTRYFAEWAYCAAGKDMMKVIRVDHEKTPEKRVNIGATWQLEPVVNFYRVAWKLDWIEPVGRESPNGAHDYYVLGAGDLALVDSLRLNLRLRDSLSGTVLAKR